MANTMLVITLFAANLIFVTANDCECSDKVVSDEAKEVFDFLSSEEYNTDIDVIPGELNPLVKCNCIENNRQKRKTDLQDGHEQHNHGKHEHGRHRHGKERSREERSPTFFRAWRHANEQRNKCPIGYRRLAFMCVKHP